MSNRARQKRRLGSSSLHGRIHQALSRGDIALAAEHAQAALDAGQIDPLVLNLAAWRMEEAGDFAAAHALLQRALALVPGDVMILGSMGALLRKQGYLDEALLILDRVVAAEPRHAAAWLERGYVLDDLRADREAAQSYKRALNVDPALAPALGKLADGAARRGQIAESEVFAERALAINPQEPSANFALAQLAVERKAPVEAEHRLHALLATTLKSEDRTRTLTLLGDALDRQGREAEAFRYYTQAQLNFRAAYASLLQPGSTKRSHRAFIEHVTAQVSETGRVPAEALNNARGPAATHVFLLGYPRSGTTLIENILASAANVIALEERDTMNEIDSALLADDGTMPDLDRLSTQQLDQLRADYWVRVERFGGPIRDKVLVDMNPFNGIKLPIIARLFPSAKIVVMRRDPRDVVLSCFRVNFTPSAGAWAFSDLSETAQHYDALMRLIDLCMMNLPLSFHEVRYDRLVASFASTVRELADFIGLAWTDAFDDFAATAQQRGVRTASVTQVRRGLYNGGGQWRRYADELAPVFPILSPWIARFGSER